MKDEGRIRLLQTRLQNLTANEKDNQGVCRKIRRELRILKGQQGQGCKEN